MPLPDVGNVLNLPGDHVPAHRDRLVIGLVKMLHLSVRTIPCGGVLHLYGQPMQTLHAFAIQHQAEDGAAARLVVDMERGGRCPRNPSTYHMLDLDVIVWASALGLRQNVWQDSLV